MKAEDALLEIQEIMSGVIWTPETLAKVAEVMEKAGYKIEDTE